MKKPMKTDHYGQVMTNPDGSTMRDDVITGLAKETPSSGSERRLVRPGRGYRLLKPRENVEATDEFYYHLPPYGWHPVTQHGIHSRPLTSPLPHRRRIHRTSGLTGAQKRLLKLCAAHILKCMWLPAHLKRDRQVALRLAAKGMIERTGVLEGAYKLNAKGAGYLASEREG